LATNAPRRRSMLRHWAHVSYHYRWPVIGAWVAVVVALLFLALRFGGEPETNFSLPGSESQAARDLLESRFPQRAGGNADIVWEAPPGRTINDIKPEIEALLAAVKAVPNVVGVTSPFDIPAYISKDGTVARADVRWTKIGPELPHEDIMQFVTLADGANTGGVRVEVGGPIVSAVEDPEFGSEGLGILAAMVILFIAFGSVVAMGLPIAAAIVGIGTGTALVMLLSRIVGIPDFTTQFIAMIGIGVGIDYSLLVVTRFREGLHHGGTVEESVALAVNTAGRAVVFAGLVVAIAFFGLFAMGLPFLAALGASSAIVVGVAVLVSLFLMPALLSVTGHKVDRWKVPLLHSTEGLDINSGWYRLSRAIQRRPLPYLVGGVALLLLFASPVLAMKIGFSDAGTRPDHYHTRRAYDLLAKGFGPGFNAPLAIVLDLSGGGADKVPAVAAALAADPDVVQVDAPVLNQARDTAFITVIPDSKPQASETKGLVDRLRATVVPDLLEGSGARGYVSGFTAGNIDVQERITSRMPLLFTGVIGLSFLLLMAVFRSVIVALKAAIMNLLSIGAAYGAVVAVFQWGWGANLIGAETGPIEVFLPMMFFCILFGLSMDYEVFLISRIREYYMKSGDNAESVANGLAATARVITAAAAIMVAVFLAFVLGEDRIVKQIGLGLAAAIFVDATVVRLILVPSTMELLGNANWWLPGWLSKIMPEIHIEAEDPELEVTPAPAFGAGGS
jgi:putative drug exporter of the RND superfamily